MNINRVMIITGGTGGHIFPGLVIAKCLKKRGCFVKWIGTKNRLESILVPKYKIDIEYVYIPNFLNLISINFLFNFFVYIKSIYLIIRKIKCWKPDLILGFGGYISFCGVISAWLCKINSIIHEQNSIVGFSNKILYYFATKSLQAFPNTFNSNVITVGNPIREDILSIKPPNIRLINRIGKINILIIGGSQGSEIINNVIFKVIKILDISKYSFLHQVGYLNYKKNLSLIKNISNNNYVCVDFIYDMCNAYNWADLIICRSGALTVSEISNVGLAAIFIPFIYNNNHQYLNAKFLSKNNSAIIINENKLDEFLLVNIILKLDRKKLFNMSNLSYLNRIKNSNEKFIKEIYNF